jgi:hypothetical protein
VAVSERELTHDESSTLRCGDCGSSGVIAVARFIFGVTGRRRVVSKGRGTTLSEINYETSERRKPRLAAHRYRDGPKRRLPPFPSACMIDVGVHRRYVT